MTVIQPNSITGITSLTCTSDSLSIHNSSGALIQNLVSGGITTTTALSVSGVSTMTGGVNVGTAATIKANGNATFSGIVTASSFVGDGSGLTGAGPSLTGSTNNTVVTVTGSNAIQGEANLTYDGTDLVVNGSGDKAIRWATGGTNKWSLYHNNGSGALVAYDNANNAERARIDSSGNFMIGTSTYQNGGFGGTSSGINVVGTQPQVLLYETDTDKDGYFGLAGSILRIQTADAIPVTIWTNDTKRINVHETTGDTTLETGNLVIGTAGKGIDFSAQTASSATGASTTAELLDHYEEGTWTPTVNVGTVGSYITGTYTRIGRMVYLTIGLYAFSDQSSNSAVIISGVPFAATGTSIGNVWLRRTAGGNANYCCTIGESGASLLALNYDSNGNDMGGNLVYSNFSHATPYMNISISYQTT